MVTFTEQLPHKGGYRVALGNGDISTENIRLAAGFGLLRPGQMLGQVTVGAKEAVGAAGVPAPVAATITAAPAVDATAKPGVHLFRCIIGGAAAASKWAHIDPDGKPVGVASATMEYAGGGLSGITIADAGTDPVAGETLHVTVTEAAASDLFVPIDKTGTDGRQNYGGILFAGVDTGDDDEADPLDAVADVRQMTVNAAELVWPAGYTDGDKAAVLAQARAQAVIAR